MILYMVHSCVKNDGYTGHKGMNMISNYTLLRCGFLMTFKWFCWYHFVTISLNTCYKAGWIHAFMQFIPNSDPHIWTSQQKSSHMRAGNVFPVFLSSNFDETVWTVALVSCSWLTGVTPSVVCCPCSCFNDQHVVHLCCASQRNIQRCSTAKLDSDKWLLELLLPYYKVWLLSSDLWYQQGVFAHRTAVHWTFSLWTTLCKP